MNRSNIEWCDFTWNPIVGCRNGCSYCWANRMHDRFNKGNNFSWPSFFPGRLNDPLKRIRPARIFVCSMADIFSEGVSSAWIEEIIDVIRQTPQHEYYFLTKLPHRYREFDFPKNCWLGTTVDHRDHAYRISQLLECGCAYSRFAVVEPLLSSMEGVDFSEMDVVYVGAMTGPGAIIPEKEWIASVKHHNLIYKENIKHLLS